MNITDLINLVGAENVTVQSLEQTMFGCELSKREKCTKITFGTRAISPSDIVTDNPKRKLGLIMWLPKDKLPGVV